MPKTIRRAVRRASGRLVRPFLPRRATPIAQHAELVVRAQRDVPGEQHDTVLLDHPGPLVRPYLVAYEQQERRTTLELALDGIDTGPWVIHGHEVGMPVMGVAA